ncbi:MAG: hypothetical protein B9S32_07295 [Verrucomicrobia bacterium Tous-C9LFEB]|nr:MAG: hypothetical protein B9S32_07295 [Verrucomicrobia bacterium Tous-C9LFEB]
MQATHSIPDQKQELLVSHQEGCQAVIGVSLDGWERKTFFGESSFEEGGHRVEWLTEMKSKSYWERLADLQPEVLISGWHTPFLESDFLRYELPSLKYICHVPGSVRHVVPRDFIERGGLVTNWGGSISQMVAEHALLLVLACLRNISQWRQVIAQRESGKEVVFFSKTLFERRVGIHGMGAVARHLANLLRPFGCTLKGYSSGVPSRVFLSAGVQGVASLEELFSESDILVECEALTKETSGAVTRALLELLPEDAVFVNVGRGAVVDEQALLEMAAVGRVRVGLDVLQREPVRIVDPAMSTQGVLVSPHIAGPTHDRLRSCGQFAIENVRRYFANEPLEGQVTLAVYDRST